MQVLEIGKKNRFQQNNAFDANLRIRTPCALSEIHRRRMEWHVQYTVRTVEYLHLQFPTRIIPLPSLPTHEQEEIKKKRSADRQAELTVQHSTPQHSRAHNTGEHSTPQHTTAHHSTPHHSYQSIRLLYTVWHGRMHATLHNQFPHTKPIGKFNTHSSHRESE